MSSEPAEIRVPDNELPVFRELASSDLSTLEAIGESLGKATANLDLEALSASVSGQLNTSDAIVYPIISALSRLVYVRSLLGLDTERFMSLVSQDLRKRDDKTWSAKDGVRWAEREPSIASLISPGSTISMSFKAGELLLKQQHVFTESLIVTDLRPIFNEPADEIKGFLPFHTMAITYCDSAEPREIFMAMDMRDLLELRKQVDRAVRKERLLKANLRAVSWPVIETEEQRDA